jgi:glutamate racemase
MFGKDGLRTSSTILGCTHFKILKQCHSMLTTEESEHIK